MIKFGNVKVDSCTAIFNMSPATECPSDRLGLCKMSKHCYAKKPEVDFRAARVLPYRQAQRRYWFETSAEQFVSDFIETISARRIKVTHFRVSESGDFHTQKCVDKFATIANLLKGHGIRTYAYTCRHDLDFSDRGALSIVGSGHMYDSQFIPTPNPEQACENARARGEKAFVCGSGCGGKCDACGEIGAKIYARIL